MKVLLVNGSPHKEGSTYTALDEIAVTLKEEGIDSEFFWIGKKPIAGCTSCGTCFKTGECVFGDIVNEFVKKAAEFDGFIFGSPVYFSGMNGAMMAFMDRVFYSSSRIADKTFAFKPVAAITCARRAGTSSALDQMNKYFLYSQMLIVTSRYWNMVHGNSPEEVRQDAEGLQIMRYLGRNMAWALKLKEAGDLAGIPHPEQEEKKLFTNFIR